MSTYNYDPHEILTGGAGIRMDVQHHAIGGKLLTASMEFPEMEFSFYKNETEWKNSLRQKLATQLALGMLENNLIYYIQIQNPVTFATTVKARCYLAPNDQVKILYDATQRS